jgi:hypothetical protein
MTQHDLVLSLQAQGKSATEIHHHLVQAFGEPAIVYSTVTRIIRQSSWAIPEEDARDLGGRSPNQAISARIRQVLDESPGTSIRQIADEAEIPASTVWYVLTTRMGYAWRKCRLIPYILTEAQQQQRIHQSQLLLAILHRTKSTGWRFFSTGDESWFFYYMPHQKFWIPPDVDAPEVSRQLIATPKLMVTIFWAISRIYVINYFSPWSSFDAAYFVDHILNSFETPPAVLLAKRNKKSFVIHRANSPIHKSRSSMAKISNRPVHFAPHPLYSQDLAPSNFFLFDHLKSMMIEQEFDSPEDLIAWIEATFERISKQVIQYVFEDWIERVERCIAHEDSYFSED